MSTGQEDRVIEIPVQVVETGPLEEADVRAAVRLVGEVAGMTASLVQRRRTLLSKLTELVDGDAWVWTTSTGFEPAQTPMTVGIIYGGFTEREFGTLLEASQDTDCPMPENPPMIEALASWQHVTRQRSEWVADEDFYSDPQWDLYRKAAGTDHYIWSLVPFDAKYVSGVGIHRRPGRPDFTPRDKRLVHIVTGEVQWLHRLDLDEEPVDSPIGLSPRLRVIFALLLQGWNRKRIAAHLGISATTVAGYQRQVYQHFAVAGQPELLAQFIRGDGGDLAG